MSTAARNSGSPATRPPPIAVATASGRRIALRWGWDTACSHPPAARPAIRAAITAWMRKPWGSRLHTLSVPRRSPSTGIHTHRRQNADSARQAMGSSTSGRAVMGGASSAGATGAGAGAGRGGGATAVTGGAGSGSGSGWNEPEGVQSTVSSVEPISTRSPGERAVRRGDRCAVDRRAGAGGQVLDAQHGVAEPDHRVAPRHPRVGEHDVHHRSAPEGGLGATEPESGSVVLTSGDREDVGRHRRADRPATPWRCSGRPAA